MGDVTDSTCLENVFGGVDGVFAMTTPFEAGMDAEVQQGITLADAAKKANVPNYVFTSVASADRETKIPHFETKWKIEQHITRQRLPAVILRPTGFMENFSTYFVPTPEGKLILPLRPETPMQMVALQDIAKFAVAALVDPSPFRGQPIELAGDSLTMPEVADHLSRTMNRKITFESMPDDQAESVMGPDFATMFRWLNEVGYDVDIAKLRQRYGIPLTTFAEVIGDAEGAKG